MENPQAPDPCIICNKPNGRRCSRCKSASYCSKTCQRGDYPIHKLLCSSFSAFDITTRPTEQSTRAILFPVDQKHPKLIWLEYSQTDFGVPYDEIWHIAYLQPFLDGDPGFIYKLRYNRVLPRTLSDEIHICCRNSYQTDGSAPNKCTSAITNTVPGWQHDWRGPVVAYGAFGLNLEPEHFRDINMSDLRHIADYFTSYCSDRTSSLPIIPPATPKIKGVRINCLGDQKMFNKPQLEAIDLPTNHDIFTEHDSSDIAERIGLPIFTKRCFPHPNWASEKNWDVFRGEIPYSNLDAGFLHMGCDPEAEFDHSGRTAAWGCPSVPWTWGVGSVIVVRQDKKPLLPLHVEALCKYCSCDAAPYMAHSTGMFEPEEPMSKDLVLSIICRPAFIIRWHKVVGEKREKGEIVDVPSPYDV